MKHSICLLLALTLLPACASDGPERPTSSRDAVLESPQNHVPEGVQDIRSELASQRSQTLSQMDAKTGSTTTGGADDGPWYGGLFDALDFATSLGGLLR